MNKLEAYQSNVEPPKPSRPYTDYNIFFQLEREYVLQVLLGVKPTLNGSDVFDSADEDYYGPSLPSRYNKLVLPDDWYVPGKMRRRKRRHRKSHGKISFHDLSQKIAQAWSDIDKETLAFCAKLSDIGVLQYKEAMRKYKKTISTRKMILSRKNLLLDPDNTNQNNDSFEVPEEMQPKKEIKSLSSNIASFDTVPDDCDRRHEPSNPYGTGLQFLGNPAQSFDDGIFDDETKKNLALLHSTEAIKEWADHCVDMEDDEIRFLWASVSD